MADNKDVHHPRSDSSSGFTNRHAVSAEGTESLLSVSGAHAIKDSRKRDSVLAFSQYVIMTLSFIYAVFAMFAHWHSCYMHYPWQVTEWELAVIFTPLGGGTLWSWLASKGKK